MYHRNMYVPYVNTVTVP